VVDWSPPERLRAAQLIASALQGVGRNKERHERTVYSVQVRRLASEEEMRIIGPAIDVR
jgi:hypothetical protein